MEATVYVVATFHRWGDELHAFGSEREAKTCVMAYAEELWDVDRFGRFPETYDQLHAAWNEHDLWGSIESRWELQSFDIELPSLAPTTRVPAADISERE